ncbi:MAG: nitroreductase family deazaflavin-dependent oxidoreductase [Chloroflexota bacterium]
MTTDAQAWEEQLIADLRANGGSPSQGPLAGHPIMLMWTTGAKSGERRRSIVTYSTNGDGYVICGTNGGSKDKHPGWLANIHADRNVTIEVANQTMAATAAEVTGPERDQLWAEHVAQLPWFGKYPEQITERTIPVVRLTVRESAA